MWYFFLGYALGAVVTAAVLLFILLKSGNSEENS